MIASWRTPKPVRPAGRRCTGSACPLPPPLPRLGPPPPTRRQAPFRLREAISVDAPPPAAPPAGMGPAKVKLLFGPYRRPRLRLGQRVHCLYRDRLVVVHGWSDAPFSWPTCRNAEGRGQPGILVEEELAPDPPAPPPAGRKRGCSSSSDTE
jgi:hypothetical protein